MDWNAEVDRWDKRLHSEGVTDDKRNLRMQALFSAYSDIDRAIRDAQAERSKLSVEVHKCRHIGTGETAREAKITPRGMRKRRTRYFNKYGTVKPYTRFRCR